MLQVREPASIHMAAVISLRVYERASHTSAESGQLHSANITGHEYSSQFQSKELCE